MPEQPGRAREQRHPAQQLRRQAEIGERRAPHPRAIQRQRATQYLTMHPANRLEQPQVRPPQPLMLGNRDDHRRAWVTALVDGMPQPRNVSAGGTFHRDGPARERFPLLLGRRWIALDRRQHASEKAARILGDAQEARASAQEARRDCALQRIRRAIERQAGGNRRRGEAMIGQRDENRLEDAHLLRRRPPLRRHPERKLAEPDLAEQIARQILPEQLDARRGGCPDPGGILDRWLLLTAGPHLHPRFQLSPPSFVALRFLRSSVLCSFSRLQLSQIALDGFAGWWSGLSADAGWRSQARTCSLSCPSVGGGSS